MSSDNRKEDLKRSNKRLAAWFLVGVIAMFGFTYLMVPVFTFICQKAGINGKGALVAANPESNDAIDYSRTIKIQLTASLHNRFPFTFKPLDRYVYVHPGERKLIYFYAENHSHVFKTVQAVPSITPADGARFFKKIECFCFTQQDFKPGEKVKMFVNFYLESDIPKDVKEMTLAYTLFDATAYRNKNAVAVKGRVVDA